MKKTYTKPKMFFESFELSTSVAANCSGAVANQQMYSCGIQIGEGVLFVDRNVCTILDNIFPNQYAEDQPCYDISQNTNLWTS